MSDDIFMPPKSLTYVKGMPDILPCDMPKWHLLEREILNLMHNYSYQEIRTPHLEYTSLFKRTIGETTDIVEKEMFSFLDRNNESLSLRPEGTAGCARACIEHALLRNKQQQRLWYLGNMYRYERPQKGRYRQFTQLGVEAFNFEGPEIEAEQIAMMARLWSRLGLDSVVNLEINNLGDTNTRKIYKQHLTDYLQKNYDKLDADSKRRLVSNPLRILDSKNPDLQIIIQNAPILLDYLDEASNNHFTKLQKILNNLNIKYVINPRLVRGLDYYNSTVYEWVTSELGSQSAICAGGRYDGLINQLGGETTPAVGFAMGLERVLLLMTTINVANIDFNIDGYLICIGESAMSKQLSIAEDIRNKLPKISLKTHLGLGSIKNLLKKADKSGAKFVFIIGDDEIESNSITVKFLRNANITQQRIALNDIVNIIEDIK